LVMVELLRCKGVPSPQWFSEQVPRQLSIEACHPSPYTSEVSKPWPGQGLKKVKSFGFLRGFMVVHRMNPPAPGGISSEIEATPPTGPPQAPD
jgi:hypothetical protein